MKRKISSKQFENMIAECVNQVLSESRQPQKTQNKRVSMNESQMQNYVRNIINEELENEGWIDGSKAVGREILNRFKGSPQHGRESLKQVYQQGDEEGETRKLNQQASQEFEERLQLAQKAIGILSDFYRMCKGNNIANAKGLPMIIGQLNKMLANVNREAGEEFYRNSIQDVRNSRGGNGMNRGRIAPAGDRSRMSYYTGAGVE